MITALLKQEGCTSEGSQSIEYNPLWEITSQLANWPTSQPANQLANHPAYQPANQPAS